MQSFLNKGVAEKTFYFFIIHIPPQAESFPNKFTN